MTEVKRAVDELEEYKIKNAESVKRISNGRFELLYDAHHNMTFFDYKTMRSCSEEEFFTAMERGLEGILTRCNPTVK